MTCFQSLRMYRYVPPWQLPQIVKEVMYNTYKARLILRTSKRFLVLADNSSSDGDFHCPATDPLHTTPYSLLSGPPTNTRECWGNTEPRKLWKPTHRNGTGQLYVQHYIESQCNCHFDGILYQLWVWLFLMRRDSKRYFRQKSNFSLLMISQAFNEQVGKLTGPKEGVREHDDDRECWLVRQE